MLLAVRPANRKIRERAGFVEVHGTHEGFAGTRTLVFNASHYRDARPSNECWMRATLSLNEETRHDEERTVASSIWVAE